jgi:hypothetical protein
MKARCSLQWLPMVSIGIAVALLHPAAARADDFLLAQSAAHKLKVFAGGGAKWCGPHLTLRMVLDADSPDIANPAAQNDVLNRLKMPIGSEYAAAADATASVLAQGKPTGGYQASKADGWVFKSNVSATTAHQPASLDTEAEQKGAVTAAAASARTAPGDVAGGSDPAFLKRYQGSSIIAH